MALEFRAWSGVPDGGPRMNKDTLIGIVGALVLVAVMVLVFAYESVNVEAADGTGDDLVASIDQASVSGSVAVGSSDSKTDNITAVGPRNLTFTLTWTASQGSATLRLTVTPPSGGTDVTAMTSQAEDDGSITVKVPIPADYARQGLWTVKVDFTQATPDDLPGGISPPVGGMTDSAVSYTVAVAFA